MRDPHGLYLTEAQLRHRGVYELAARKLVLGVWDAERRGFLGLYDYVEYEYLWTETEGTASAIRLVEMLPAAIELRSHDPSTCALHDRPVRFQKRNDGTPLGDWFHADDDSPLVGDDMALGRSYKPMHTYLVAKTVYPSG